MNLTNYKLEETAWLESVYAPDGEKTDIRIELASRDSQKYQARIKKLAEKNRKALKGLDINTVEKETMNIYVACTINWENIQDNGKDVPCTPEEIERIYTMAPWIFEQVREFIEDRANFLAS